MKNAIIVGILVAASLLTGCRSNTGKVRNGYLEYNRTITVGQALEHTFSKGSWKSFQSDKGATIVEFDGFQPFSESEGTAACLDRPACADLTKQIEDYCNSDQGKAAYAKDQIAYNGTKDQIAQLKQQREGFYAQIEELRRTPSSVKVSSSSQVPLAEQIEQGKKASDLKDQQIDELSKRASDADTQATILSNQLYTAPDGHASCVGGTYKQHANDPIPIAVQFSINADGTTFQYYANDMGWSAERLFSDMYK